MVPAVMVPVMAFAAGFAMFMLKLALHKMCIRDRYEVLLNGEADVAPAYTTEGQLAEKDKFMLLEDDKQVWPPYNLAPVVRDDTLAKNPEIADILNKISASLDTDTVTALNAEVDVNKREYEEVAREYYDTIK